MSNFLEDPAICGQDLLLPFFQEMGAATDFCLTVLVYGVVATKYAGMIFEVSAHKLTFIFWSQNHWHSYVVYTIL